MPAAARTISSIASPMKPNAGMGNTEMQGAMVFESRVTAPLRARARPDNPAPVVMVMLVSARMFPRNPLPVPRVAELPTTQFRFGGQGLLVLIRTTDEPLAVVSVLPILNRKFALGLPWKSRVNVPVRDADDEKQ